MLHVLFAPTIEGRDALVQVALVWDASGDAAARNSVRNQSRDWPPPDNLNDLAERAGIQLDPAQAHYFTAVFKYHRTRQMKLGLIEATTSTPTR
jgi:hypothetical protein